MKNILLLLLIILSNNAYAKTTGDENMNKIVQTAGRDILGDFAPEFAHYNDDVLFGENWNDKGIDLKTRSLLTVTALMSQGITDSSLIHHLQNAKNNGVTKQEIASTITHVAFYAGWPKAWATFRLAKEIWNEEKGDNESLESYAKTLLFPVGNENTAYAKYFIGKSYLAPISTEQVKFFNVTFEPKCRNNWHIHHAKKGGGQMLVGIGGKGYYQEWGKAPVEINVGDVVHIPANVKHWHGASSNSWFSHLAFELDGEETSNEWLEPVTDEEYNKIGK